MGSDITIRKVGDISILNLTMAASRQTGIDDLRGALARVREQGSKDVLISLGEATHLESAVLGELLGLQAELREQGGRVGLVARGAGTRHLLRSMHLDAVIAIFEDEASALSGFGASNA